VIRLWARRRDLILGFYGIWLSVLTVIHFGWPWAW
jgi:hypothetical protein